MGVDASASRPLRILAFVEAATVTGPAKNLIEFRRTVRDGTQRKFPSRHSHEASNPLPSPMQSARLISRWY